MSNLLRFSLVLFALGAAALLAVAFLLYKPCYGPFTNGKKSEPLVSFNETVASSSENGPVESGNQTENGTLPEAVAERVEQLSTVLPTYFVYLRGGIGKTPALVFRVSSNNGTNRVFLLSFNPMEWPFVKLKLSSGSFGSPDAVYNCDGLLLIEYDLPGIPPPEVDRGALGKYGVLVAVSDDGSLSYWPYSGSCDRNGFVFNLAGELAGVCFGGNFISSDALYGEVPQACKLVYRKEGDNGNL